MGSAHTHVPTQQCVPEAPHNPTPIYPVNCVAARSRSDAPHKLAHAASVLSEALYQTAQHNYADLNPALFHQPLAPNNILTLH
jgi:hypothetical protein